ncbi:hypothetical protein ROZALSC1DRAFT_24682, partial [Rozella allomycis CSF55]
KYANNALAMELFGDVVRNCEKKILLNDLPLMVIGPANFLPGFGPSTITKCIIRHSSVDVLDHLIMANAFKESYVLLDVFFYTSSVSTENFHFPVENHMSRLSAAHQFSLFQHDFRLRDLRNELRPLALSKCEPEILPCFYSKLINRNFNLIDAKTMTPSNPPCPMAIKFIHLLVVLSKSFKEPI